MTAPLPSGQKEHKSQRISSITSYWLYAHILDKAFALETADGTRARLTKMVSTEKTLGVLDKRAHMQAGHTIKSWPTYYER